MPTILTFLAGVAAAAAAAAVAPDFGQPTIIPLAATVAAFLYGGFVRARGGGREAVADAALDGGFIGTGVGIVLYVVALVTAAL